MRPRLDLSQKSGMLPAVLKLFQSNIRGTASPGPGAPPQGLLAFYWHFVSQAKGWFAAMFAPSLAVALLDTVIPLFIGRLVSLMAPADWRLGLPTLLWFCGYLLFLRYFVPRMRDLAKASSEARSLVMARVVDSYTNILTVKLFARLADEDAYVRETVDEHQGAIAAHMRLITQFMFCLTAMNAALLVSTAGIGIWLWAQGSVSAGVVATALPLAWQVANVSGWVSWEVTGIFENIGVVQEGMQSIAVPHSGADRPEARALEVSRGEIRFEDVTFGYGRRDAPPVLNELTLQIRPGERVGVVGRSGAGKST